MQRQPRLSVHGQGNEMEKISLCRPAILAFVSCVLFGAGIAPAAAGSWAARAHARDHEYYALSPSETESSAVAHHLGDCYRTNSSVEATRGIRHWTGACGGTH
jgi:hypothetical protein